MRGAPVRLSLTLPGGASLGAYQAGAVAALLVAVDRLRRSGTPVVIDALGGSSSGSLVALFAAACILDGLDPVEVLRSAWVERVSLDLLRGRGSRAPLSFDRLRAQIGSGLDPRDDSGAPIWRADGHQCDPLALHIGLTDLQGLTYELANQEDGSLVATTYVDWSTFVLEAGRGLPQLLAPEGRSPLDVALASAANPAVFAPRMLDRGADADRYHTHGVTNFPESGRLWYSDGGLVQAEPVGRTLNAARRVAGDGPGRRLHVVVDPRSEGPSGSKRWSDPDRVPSWTSGLSRSLAIIPAQIVYDDLRRVVRDNRRLRNVDETATRLAAELRPEAETVLRGMLADVTGREAAEGHGRRELLRELLAELSGVAGKELVDVELISPLLLARTSRHDVPQLLAGEFLGTFGGFLNQRLRASDFALGWDSTSAWVPDGLRRLGLRDDVVDDVVSAVDERRDHSWRRVNIGRTGADDLPLAARLAFARLVLHVAKVLVADALPQAVSSAPRRLTRLLVRSR